jgi:hypothetical protein
MYLLVFSILYSFKWDVERVEHRGEEEPLISRQKGRNGHEHQAFSNWSHTLYLASFVEP